MEPLRMILALTISCSTLTAAAGAALTQERPPLNGYAIQIIHRDQLFSQNAMTGPELKCKTGFTLPPEMIVKRAGKRIGIRRLESETLSELSQLAYDLGDAQIARHRAIEALRIANEALLGLRQTHCLVVLGKATILAGQRDLGVAYLRHAKGLADRQEYWLRRAEAEELLQKHEEQGDDRRAWEGRQARPPDA